MAGQAAFIDFLGGMVFEDENLCYIAATSDVGCAGTVAPFAALLGGPSVRVVQCFPVRSLLVIIVDILVARPASISPHVVGGVCSGSGRLVLRGGTACIGRNLCLSV